MYYDDSFFAGVFFFFCCLLYSKEHINYRIILLQQHSTKRENSYTVLRSIGEIGLGSLAHK